jgi:hypothetical protein
LPDGFELFESPIDARASIRKKSPSDIHDTEMQFVQERTNVTVWNVIAQLVIEGRSIVIHKSARAGEPKSMAANFGGLISGSGDITPSASPMSPTFRLHDLQMRKEYGDDWDLHAPDQHIASKDRDAGNDFYQDIDLIANCRRKDNGHYR